MSESESSSTSGATPSISDKPDPIANSQTKAASTGPRTLQGKSRSARNASKHRIFVGRILPEEEKQAAYICEELLQDLDPQRLLEREIVLALVVNLVQRRRIDRYSVNSIGKARAHCFEAFVEKEEQSQAERWLRHADTRRASAADWKRLAPEACVEVLSALRACVQERGPSPEEDMEALGRVYGQEPTALGAMTIFFYHALKSNRDLRNERDEKRKVEHEQLREEILGTLETEIQFQRSRVERKHTIVQTESSSNVTVPSPDVGDSIQRYYAANAREFTHLLDALERVRRLRKQP